MGSLKRHKKGVHEGFKYSCDICPRQFSAVKDVKEHKKSVHEGMKYPCDLCPYKVSYLRNLKVHKKAVHQGIKRHKKMIHEETNY